MSVAETVEKFLFVPAVPDVIADVIGVLESQDNEIMSLAVAQRARAGGLGFFVRSLAVNDRRRRFARIFPDAFPNTHHVAAGRIHDLAAAIFDLLLNGQLGAERRHDHHVVRLQISDVRLLVFPHQVLDA